MCECSDRVYFKGHVHQLQSGQIKGHVHQLQSGQINTYTLEIISCINKLVSTTQTALILVGFNTRTFS